QKRLVRAERAVLGGSRGDQGDRSAEGAGARASLGEPDRIRAWIELAEGRLVDPRGNLRERHLRLREVRPHDRRLRRIEVAGRAVRLEALDVERGLAAVAVQPGLDPVGFLARERPGDELAEEP